MSIGYTKFSAVATVYAGERVEYLDAALASIEHQSLRPEEVIFVHDGLLTDELYHCLEKWGQLLSIKNVPLKESKRGNIAKNRNIGLEHSL